MDNVLGIIIILLPFYWGLNSIWWVAAFSDIGAFLLTGTWLWHEIHQLGKTEELPRGEPQPIIP